MRKYIGSMNMNSGMFSTCKKQTKNKISSHICILCKQKSNDLYSP